MLGREALEHYRQMTPDERLALTLRAIRESTPYLLRGSPEVVRRRFERIRQENDARNRAMLTRLAAAQALADAQTFGDAPAPAAAPDQVAPKQQ